MDNKIKIAFFIKGLRIGGTERILISYLKGLSMDSKYDIHLIINENSENNVLLRDVPKNIKITHVFSEKFDNLIEKVSLNRKSNIFYKILYSILLPYGKKLRKKKVIDYIKKEKIEILVDFERSFIKYAEEIPCKKILWNHFTFSVIKDKDKWVEYFNKYNKIVAISKEMEREIKEFYPEKEKVVMLYNPQYFQPIIEKSRDINSLNEKEKELIEDKYIVYVGRIEKVKGLEDLIDAYETCKKKGLEEKLYIIGEGTEKEKLIEIVGKKGLENDILFLGSKSNPFIWMKHGKIFGTTTYGEGLPTTYIESMICGTPVISYDCPTGPKDILENGKYGKLIELGNKEEFGKELFNILNNKEELKELKDKLPEKIGDFSIENVIDKFKEAIVEVSKI
ncbi:Glycosyltransferase involved in cell wall bisynthesis [Cetobacterium ceti]|uniref:Glycosyltransferase involved in cell wall bisynthesis n=1 Tax=Cetobacterium ceti TaxID=180163 RepID=A0A1T4LR40_9FUSO|nr:glycosyltransferase [Cetobacterium ceti]SJZ57202.1 Glycosyltransferase involved in cell wall bisynthesis [Cetobacterium ceti]